MNIPEEYHELYRSITDEMSFVFQKWYKYPSNNFQAEFIEWYYKFTMNIEFSENRTHFRVVDFSAPPIPSRRDRESNQMPWIKHSWSKEHLDEQRDYWNRFWEKKGKIVNLGPGVEDKITSTESILDDLDGL